MGKTAVQHRVVERKQGTMGHTSHSGHPLHPTLSPVVSTLSCHCEYTLATVTNLHTGGLGHRVALRWIEAAVGFGSPLATGQPSLGSLCPPPGMRKRLEKVL